MNEMTKPIVSVIVNNFDKAKYIEDTLNSIKNQTYGSENIFLLIWEDNSTDNSYNVIEDWVSNNEQYFYNVHWSTTGSILNDYSQGILPLGVTRYLALQRCVGDYVAICDSDDVWVPEKLEKQIPLFNNNIGIVYSDMCYFYETIEEPCWNTFHDYYPPFEKDVFVNLLTKYNFVPASSVVFDRRCLKACVQKASHYTSGEDYDWILKVADRYEVVNVKEPLVYYRIVQDSLTHQPRKSTRASWFEIDAAVNAYHNCCIDCGEPYKQLKRKFIQHLIWLYCKLIWKQFFREKF